MARTATRLTSARSLRAAIVDSPAASAGPARARPLTQAVGAGGPPYYCSRQEALVHDFASLGLAESPAIAADDDAGRWQRLHGSLLPQPEQASGLLCSEAFADDDCAEVVLPEMRHFVPGPGDPFTIDAWTDVDWLVLADGGRIIEIALIIPRR